MRRTAADDRAIEARVERKKTSALFPSESPPLVFISSVMDSETEGYRREAVEAVQKVANLQPWAFEYTSASPDGAQSVYLQKVREAAIVIWLATQRTTGPVQEEVREALASGSRLLVFKLYAEGATAETESLLGDVQQHVKWSKPDANEGDLGDAIRLALCDVVSRALRQPREHIGVDELLSEEWRLSIARCIERWVSLQVPHEMATNMAVDLDIVSPIKDMPLIGVAVLTGEVGVGKSLALERLFQKALQEYQSDKSRPIPVFLNAHDVDTLQGAIRLKLKALGVLRTGAVRVFIDRADEQGDGRLTTLLQEARIISGAWEDTLVVMASRELPCLTNVTECVTVSTLSYEQAAELIAKIEGDEPQAWYLKTLPLPLREAVTRPLFAIIYANCIRRRMACMPQSDAELLDELAEQAVSKASDSVGASRALRHLATQSIRRESTPVHIGDIEDQEDLRLCCQTGIVVRTGKQVQFPLLVLTHWFAAQALIKGEVNIEAIATSSTEAERWRYPFSIAVATVSHVHATRLLAPLVKQQPAFASQIVRSAVWNSTSEEDYALPPAIECGENLRSAINHWAKGIGPLARTFYPLHNRADLPPLAVKRRQRDLGVWWYEGNDKFPPVVDIERDGANLNEHDWTSSYWSVIGSQPAWAWLWSLDMMSQAVSTAVKKRLLLVPEGPLAEEVQWEWVLELMHNGGLRSEAFPLDDIERVVARLPCGLFRKFPSPLLIDTDCLRNRIKALRIASATEWSAPTPGRDLPQGNWAWSSYSPERLLEKTTCVFEKTILAYQQLVDEWFPNFRDRLEHAVTLPARVIGVVIPTSASNGLYAPCISWYFEPLPKGLKSEVVLHLGSESLPPNSLDGLYDKLKAARPEAATWISACLEQSVLDIFSAKPITKMVYKWLKHDLKKVGWIK